MPLGPWRRPRRRVRADQSRPAVFFRSFLCLSFPVVHRTLVYDWYDGEVICRVPLPPLCDPARWTTSACDGECWIPVPLPPPPPVLPYVSAGLASRSSPRSRARRRRRESNRVIAVRSWRLLRTAPSFRFPCRSAPWFPRTSRRTVRRRSCRGIPASRPSCRSR